MTQYFDLLQEKYKLFPKTILEKNRKIGIELEFHVVPIDGSKPDFNKLKNILNLILPALEYEKIDFDYDGNCIKGKKGDDWISFDTGYCIIELSPGPSLNIHEIEKKTKNLITKIEKILNKQNLTLCSLGINPFSWTSEIPFIQNGRSRGFNYFFSYYNLKKEHSYINAFTFFSAFQTHLDASLEELPDFLNTINAIAWVKALLLANSPKILSNNQNCQCFRDILTKQSGIAYHSNNVGVRNTTFSSYKEVFSDVLENSIFLLKRKDQYIFFEPTPLKEYLSKKNMQGYYLEGDKVLPIEFQVEKSDIHFSRPYNAAIITHRGTVETRSECSQPFEDSMSPAAFHLGLISNLEKIKAYLKTYESHLNKYSFSELREKAIFQCYDIQKELNFDVKKFIFDLLLLIKEGLINRGKNEEIYLECLFDRLKKESNPAKEWLTKLELGKTLPELVEEYKVKL